MAGSDSNAMDGALTKLGNGSFRLRGRLDLDCAGRVLVAGRKLMRGDGDVFIDLQQADCANTAGLALLVEWSMWCAAQGRTLHYRHAADKLLALIAVNGVGELLHLPAAQGRRFL
ncbi:MAG: hypothetical protein BMS9Abin32_703 [Gammaproteobacteria bacterium]|nr:MAG: hypothetical protein BMS9Abin32_703 [Gammaproteobacteria bacterium]